MQFKDFIINTHGLTASNLQLSRDAFLCNVMTYLWVQLAYKVLPFTFTSRVRVKLQAL